MYASKPTFIVKKNMQKSLETGVYFDDQVTPAILEDVCNRILGTKECDIQFVDNNFSNEDISATYNKGRTAFLYYKNAINIISFSENSGFFSV